MKISINTFLPHTTTVYRVRNFMNHKNMMTIPILYVCQYVLLTIKRVVASASEKSKKKTNFYSLITQRGYCCCLCAFFCFSISFSLCAESHTVKQNDIRIPLYTCLQYANVMCGCVLLYKQTGWVKREFFLLA